MVGRGRAGTGGGRAAPAAVADPGRDHGASPALAAPRAAEAILRALDASAVRGLPRLLHGEEESCWPLVAQAAREGLATRIGLEDTLAGPDGGLVSGNAELVRCALEMLGRAQR